MAKIVELNGKEGTARFEFNKEEIAALNTLLGKDQSQIALRINRYMRAAAQALDVPTIRRFGDTPNG